MKAAALHRIESVARTVAAVALAVAMWLVKQTCRHRVEDAPMATLRSQGRSYVYAKLHAHQLGAAFFGERGSLCMVSRSDDGDFLIPTLRIFGKRAVRGSSGHGRKGGAVALVELIRHLKRGGAGAIAVDGPRGPRGSVNGGIVVAAQKAGVPIIPVVVVCNRRLVLSRTWDRMQVPMPGSRLKLCFGKPIEVEPRENVDAVCRRVEAALHDLEARHDPRERSPRVKRAAAA